LATVPNDEDQTMIASRRQARVAAENIEREGKAVHCD
jgi:hypothetical protein